VSRMDMIRFHAILGKCRV